MTRNRDAMSLKDTIRTGALSAGAIVGVMLLLGAMMIAQKPEAKLELAKSPVYEMPVAPQMQRESAALDAQVAG